MFFFIIDVLLYFVWEAKKNLDPRNRMGVADQARAARQAERENSDSREISGLPRRFKAVSGLSGAVAESPGPGDNSKEATGGALKQASIRCARRPVRSL